MFYSHEEDFCCCPAAAAEHDSNSRVLMEKQPCLRGGWWRRGTIISDSTHSGLHYYKDDARRQCCSSTVKTQQKRIEGRAFETYERSGGTVNMESQQHEILQQQRLPNTLAPRRSRAQQLNRTHRPKRSFVEAKVFQFSFKQDEALSRLLLVGGCLVSS